MSTAATTETTVGQLANELNALRSRVDELESEVEDLREENKELRDELDAETETEQKDPDTPMERVHLHGFNTAGVTKTPSIDRALTIYENFPRWAEWTPNKGWVLNLGKKSLLQKLRLERNDDDALKEWVQVYRACEVLHNMTGCKVAYDEENHRLRMARPEVCRYDPDRVSYDLHALLAGEV